jgi:hypothetical protein
MCPFFEALYEGTRGPGKTDALIMDFAQHVGQGYGADWRGVIFRLTFPQLSDVIAKTKKWFYQIFPGVRFNAGDHKWIWPTGEELLLRYMSRPEDYVHFHGHEIPFIGWEELTNWPSPECYETMMSCCRSSNPDVPRKYRATCNPYGVGHAWVKARFIDPAPAGRKIIDAQGRVRVRIHGNIRENRILMRADPNYVKNLEAISDPNKRKAWLEGSWDIVAGGIISDVWQESVHVIRPFPIPRHWRIDRSFDWGSSKPFSVGWWAEADGSEITLPDGKRRWWPRGTLFHIAEWYGWNGNPNEGCRMIASEIARGILDRERAMGLAGRVQPGPADSSIFDVQEGDSIADKMARAGVRWDRADKGPGSRVNGAEMIRSRLKASLQRPMEEPGLFIFETCRHFIRTVPVLPRDPKKPDDADTAAEDHCYDSARYRAIAVRRVATHTAATGF